MRPGLRKLRDDGLCHVMDGYRPPFEHGTPPERVPGCRGAEWFLTARSQVGKQASNRLADCRRDLDRRAF